MMTVVAIMAGLLPIMWIARRREIFRDSSSAGSGV